MFPSFWTPQVVFTSAVVLRVIFFFYGLFQDAYGALPYTDIDYFVFTDAARYVYYGRSPYDRETYRYTPLLAWMLVPTAFKNPVWFSFGKLLFALSDIVAGWLIYRLLQAPNGNAMRKDQALKFASIWLLNPMVATISTRGSSEGLLGVMVIALLWAVLSQRIGLAGVLLGLAVHLKIYPFIYGVSILWFLDETPSKSSKRSNDRTETTFFQPLISSPQDFVHLCKMFLNASRVTLLVTSLATFSALNLLMYSIYGPPFLQHTFLHHLTRIDHRHNFSAYNTLLHLASFSSSTSANNNLSTGHPITAISSSSISAAILNILKPERLTFLPQILLSAILIPLTLTTRKTLPEVFLLQTFAFVTWNKVCTSQYFLWYMVLLPFYLPQSSLLARPRLGLSVVAAWVGAQALWLWYGWRLEFRGEAVFVGADADTGSSDSAGIFTGFGGLWMASLLFLAVNCWILGIMTLDVGALGWRGNLRGLEKMDVKHSEDISGQGSARNDDKDGG